MPARLLEVRCHGRAGRGCGRLVAWIERDPEPRWWFQRGHEPRREEHPTGWLAHVGRQVIPVGEHDHDQLALDCPQHRQHITIDTDQLIARAKVAEHDRRKRVWMLPLDTDHPRL